MMQKVDIHAWFKAGFTPENLLEGSYAIDALVLKEDFSLEFGKTSGISHIANSQLNLGMHSSGTTQAAKTLHCRKIGDIVTEVENLSKAWSFLSEKNIMVAAPAYHSFGLIPGLLVSRHLSSKVLYAVSSHLLQMYSWLSKNEIEVLIAAPAHLRFIAEIFEHGKRLPALQHIIWAGSPLSQRILSLFRGQGIALMQVYGTTETGAIAFGANSEKEAPDNCGYCLPHLNLELTDSGDISVKTKSGEIIHTKDKGRLNEKGQLLVTGRSDHIIFRNGNKLDLHWIAGIMQDLAHPIPVTLRYEKNIGGEIDLICGITEEVKTHAFFAKLKQHLPAYALPNRWEIVANA